MTRWVLLLAYSLLALFSCNKQKAATIPTKRESRVVAKSVIVLRKPSHVDQDSVNLDTMLHDILEYAYQHRNIIYQKKKLNCWHFEYSSEAVLSYGYLFSPNKKHLIVKRMLWGTTVAVDVFIYENMKFKHVCSGVLEENSYVDYTVKDVNGDNRKDFLIHWYPTSGCCKRDVYNVYLNQAQGRFTKEYSFINPTFSPAEKIIRGVGYGQPGDVELYKYKWNKLHVDTLEFVRPDATTKKFHIVANRAAFDDDKAGRFVTFVPKEYREIKSYQWFKGVY